MADFTQTIIDAVATWDGMTVNPHRFGGYEFNLGRVEIGHIHRGGMVDIPFTRPLREQLLAEGRAEPHHVLPETGWITYYVRSEADVAGALWLYRLSYIQKRLARSLKDPALRNQLVDLLNNLEPGPEIRTIVEL